MCMCDVCVSQVMQPASQSHVEHRGLYYMGLLLDGVVSRLINILACYCLPTDFPNAMENLDCVNS